MGIITLLILIFQKIVSRLLFICAKNVIEEKSLVIKKYAWKTNPLSIWNYGQLMQFYPIKNRVTVMNSSASFFRCFPLKFTKITLAFGVIISLIYE